MAVDYVHDDHTFALRDTAGPGIGLHRTVISRPADRNIMDYSDAWPMIAKVRVGVGSELVRKHTATASPGYKLA